MGEGKVEGGGISEMLGRSPGNLDVPEKRVQTA
jgi:hypothetical protein